MENVIPHCNFYKDGRILRVLSGGNLRKDRLQN
jgi:hypothetical protein